MHHPVNGQASNSIFETVVDSNNTIPKVLLALVSTPTVEFNIPWQYKNSMVKPATQWDGKIFALIKDIHPTSRFICTISFPDDIFDTANEQHAHKATYITSAFNVSPPTMHVLNPVADGTPDTDLITTCAIVPALHRYVHLAMSRFPLQPRAAWHTHADAILHDNNEVPMRHC